MRDFFKNIFYKSTGDKHVEEGIFEINITGLTPPTPQPSVPPIPPVPTDLLGMSLAAPSSSTDPNIQTNRSERKKVYDLIIETYIGHTEDTESEEKFKKYFDPTHDKPVTHELYVGEYIFKITSFILCIQKILLNILSFFRDESDFLLIFLLFLRLNINF